MAHLVYGDFDADQPAAAPRTSTTTSLSASAATGTASTSTNPFLAIGDNAHGESSATLATTVSARTVDSTDYSVDLDACTGAHVGPRVRIHRHDVGIRALQILIIAWLLSGMAFLTVVALCIMVNLGYVTFKSQGNILILVFAFTFYAYYLVLLYRSILRTFIRMCIGMWREKFGGGKRDFVLVRWVDPFACWIERMIHPHSSRFDGAVAESEEHYAWTEAIKTVILFLLVAGVVGAPLIYSAVTSGYWGIMSTLCVFYVLGSAIVILCVNLVARLVRFCTFAYKLATTLAASTLIPDRLKAAFLASTRQDFSRPLLDVYSEKAIFILILVMLSSVVFSGLKSNVPVLATCGTLVALALVVRARRMFKCYVRQVTDGGTDDLASVGYDETAGSTLRPRRRTLVSRCVADLEWSGHTRGQSWQPVITTQIVRSLCLAVGVAALIYMDLSPVTSMDGTAPFQVMATHHNVTLFILSAVLFVLLTIAKDLVIVVPLCHAYVRPALLVIIQSVQFTGAIYMRILFGGFTSIACLMIAIYGIDYREARWFWTSRREADVTARCPRKRRVIRNTFLILSSLIAFVVAAVVVGLAVGYFSDALRTIKRNNEARLDPNAALTVDTMHLPDVVDAWEDFLPPKNRTVASFTPPMCALSFTREDLSLVELGYMSKAAYKPTSTAALAMLDLNPKLRGAWQVGQFNLGYPKDPHNTNDTSNTPVASGVRFVEFIHMPTNLSVISIRGTHAVEDVFQDMYLWSAVCFLQMSSAFGTMVGSWPTSTVAYVNYLITNYASYPNLLYYAEMEEIIRRIMDGKPRRRPRSGFFAGLTGTLRPEDAVQSPVMVTGHSLGGGLANIIAAHLGIPSVAFSAPGLGYSTYNYNLTDADLMANTVTVVPANDPVPQFDKQTGMVVHVPCNAAQPFLCHDLSRTILSLKAICGYDFQAEDTRRRGK